MFDGVLGFISRHEKFILTAHETPDGDAIGSEYAMLLALRQLGKQARIFNADPAPRNFRFIDEHDDIETLETAGQLPTDLEDYVLIILDVNDISNIGNVAKLVLPKVKEAFIIDHHDVNTETLTTNLIQKEASSTGEIVFQIFKELNLTISLPMAKSIYMAIVYDTGSFIYPKTSALTFSIARELVLAGVSPNEIYSRVYEARSIASLKLHSAVIATLKLEFDAGVAIQVMLKDMILDSGATYEEGHQIINVPLSAEDVRVSVYFKENLEGVLRCSLRSKGNIDVAKIAQQFGGGGHKTAAGFKCSDPLEETKSKVLDYLRVYFDKGVG